MIVLKFGGTSIGSVERLKNLTPIICNDKKRKLIVLSAMAKTTDSLEEISQFLHAKEKEKAYHMIRELSVKYHKIADELFTTKEYKKEGNRLIKSHFNYIQRFTIDVFSILEEKTILAQGELLSTALLHYYLKEKGIHSVLLSALKFMRIDEEGEPDHYYIKESLTKELKKYPSDNLFITQGYICRNTFGDIDNLKRGGSDYSASLIGSAIKAKEIQIWTDTNGIRNNDPRFVDKTNAIRSLSFAESAELAYFGAKILHPASILPAQANSIPVRLKNTLNPHDEGTLISKRFDKSQEIKAVASKDCITVVKIKSGRMLMAYGFLRKIFEIFEIYKTAIDVLATSEVAVSISIDNDQYLDDIVFELRKFGYVEIDKGLSVICVVGDFSAETSGLAAKVFQALKDIPVRMISYGGSYYNITVIIKQKYKKEALNILNEQLFFN